MFPFSSGSLPWPSWPWSSSWLTGRTPLRMVQSPPFTVEVPGVEPVEGETVPRRHPQARDGLVVLPAEGVHTTFDLLRRSAQVHADRPAVASRRLLHAHKEKKMVAKVVGGRATEVEKEWTFYEMSTYTSLTYGQYYAVVLQVAAGLRKLGLTRGDRVHVFASTSQQWLTMAHAAASQGLVIVTAYDTLGPSGVEHSLVQSKAATMFVDPRLLPTVGGLLARAEAVRTVIYNDASNSPVPDAELDQFRVAHPDLTLRSLEEVRRLGEVNPVDPVPPAPEDMFCIMYTSGSTGQPKGVTVTHASFIAGVAGLLAIVEGVVSHRDRVMAYLPLAHIFELELENLTLFLGASLGYGDKRTLSDKDMRHCRGDMVAFRPTILAGVPEAWDRVKKGIEERVSGLNPVVRAAFAVAFDLEAYCVRRGFWGLGDLVGLIAFRQVRALTGGHLRFIVNGAGGISPTTQHYLSMTVAPMLIGYGMTETCGCGFIGSPLQWTPDAAGTLPASIEAKLVSCPDLGYTATDTPSPRGEVYLRGPTVTAGYYDNPEENAGAFVPGEDGRGRWFRTGDIGLFDARGLLRVVDRAKNLVKLSGGEYIALERLEAAYRSDALVQQVLVHGDSLHARPVAVVMPVEHALERLAAGLGVDAAEMYSDGRVRGAVLDALRALARREGMAGMETLVGVVVVDDEWTPQNGLVTATLKLNRRALTTKYAEVIRDCFDGK